MRTHRGYRIQEAGAVLYPRAVDGVRIVGAPDLGRVIQHTHVKPSAASGAPFDQQIRIITVQPLQEIIQPEYIIVENLSLGQTAMRIHIEDGTVEVPFDIFDIRAVQDLADGIDRSRLPPLSWRNPGSADCVRAPDVCPVSSSPSRDAPCKVPNLH